MKSITKILLPFLFVLFAMVNCSKDDSPTSPICPDDGEFVVDAYSITARVQTNPETDSLWCHLEFSFTYHFENVPGNILSRVQQVKDYLWNRLFISPAGPKSPNIPQKWEETAWLRDDMNGVDSLYIVVTFYGVLSPESECAEGFERTQETAIPVKRD